MSAIEDIQIILGMAQSAIAENRIPEAELHIDQAQRRLNKLSVQHAEDSWKGAVDRQGGSFSQDEIDKAEANKW
jgi:hypothetical protein